MVWWIPKLFGAGAGFPAAGTQFGFARHAKPMQVIHRLIAQPVERLALGTTHLVPGLEGFDHLHVGFHFRDHGDPPALADFFLGLLLNVAQVADHDVRPPTQALPTLPDAALEQIAFRHMCGRGPTDQWCQQHRWFITAQPQTQRMLFVADEEPGVTGFERARPERGALGRPGTTVFFLSAGGARQTLASINATRFPPP